MSVMTEPTKVPDVIVVYNKCSMFTVASSATARQGANHSETRLVNLLQAADSTAISDGKVQITLILRLQRSDHETLCVPSGTVNHQSSP